MTYSQPPTLMSSLNPRIKALLFLDFAQAGLFKKDLEAKKFPKHNCKPFSETPCTDLHINIHINLYI